MGQLASNRSRLTAAEKPLQQRSQSLKPLNVHNSTSRGFSLLAALLEVFLSSLNHHLGTSFSMEKSQTN
jgi:hypothetical protein